MLQGMNYKATQLINKQTMEWETVYILKDYEKTIGIFEDTEMAAFFWDEIYLDSERTATYFPDKWFIEPTDIKGGMV